MQNNNMKNNNKRVRYISIFVYVHMKKNFWNGTCKTYSSSFNKIKYVFWMKIYFVLKNGLLHMFMVWAVGGTEDNNIRKGRSSQGRAQRPAQSR